MASESHISLIIVVDKILALVFTDSRASLVSLQSLFAQRLLTLSYGVRAKALSIVLDSVERL